MRDIKYEALYNRGSLGANPIEFSAGLVLLLANLNYLHYILPRLIPSGSHTQFRLKFITAFQTNSNIKAIQDRLVATKSLSAETKDIFRDALGNTDSRWLRKRRRLRNLLTHYLPDSRIISELPLGATRVDTIEHLGGGLTFGEIDALLDRNIAHLSSLLESGFRLAGDPFWLGKVT